MRRVFGILFWTLMAIVLLPTAVLLILYSQWGQDSLRHRILDKLNQEKGIELRLDALSLRFPLSLDIKGLSLIQYGDTMIAARNAIVDVKLMPLLAGDVSVAELALGGVRYQMGAPDSLSMIVLKADSLRLQPAKVVLRNMHISGDDGFIWGGSFAMTSKVDTTLSTTPPDTTSTMDIRVGRLALRDFTFNMALQGTIDSLGAHIADGVVQGVHVDLSSQTVNVKDFRGKRLDAAFVSPDSAQVAAAPVAPESPYPAKPWTVQIDSLRFSDSHALYTTHGYEPQPGLDFGYIELDSLDLAIANLYNQATTLRLPISLQGRERCGVALDATGVFEMDSTAMRFTDFVVNTPYSSITADGLLGVGDMTADPKLPMRLATHASIGIPDLKMMFPISQPYLAGISEKTPVDLAVDLSGTAGNLRIKEAKLKINRCVNLDARGFVADAFSTRGPSGDITLDGNIIDVKSVVDEFMQPGSGITIPPMKLNGHVAMRSGDIKGTLDATTLGGTLALAAEYLDRSEGYDISLKTHDFPVNAFMADLGVGRATIDLTAKGNGFDLFSTTTNAEANILAHSVEYGGYDYRGIALGASLHDGMANIGIDSTDPALDANIKAMGNLDGDTYDWTASVDGPHIDLFAMKMSETPAVIGLKLTATASASSDMKDISATAILNDFSYTQDVGRYAFSNVKANFTASDSTTNLTITNRDFHAIAEAPCGLDTLIDKFDKFSQLLDHQLAERRLNPDSLQQALPRFSISALGGEDNFINDILAEDKSSIQHLYLDATNDNSLHFDSQILGFDSQSFDMDTVRVKAEQSKGRIHMIANLDNRPGTLDEWAHVRLDAILNTNKLALRVTQRDIRNVMGYDVGTIISQVDSTAVLNIFPLNPTIAYKSWTVNFDNYIKYNFPHKMVDANLYMNSDKSSLAIYSASRPIGPIEGNAHNDIAVEISKVNISDWIQLNPFAPPIAGQLSANMRVLWDGASEINGQGTVNFDDFYYDKQRVGSFATNMDVSTNTAGTIRASANLLVDGQETMKLSGVLNDSTATTPFDLDLDVIKFPLHIANPFLPIDIAQLKGTLNGDMQVSGDIDKPTLNGVLYFEDAAVKAAITNTNYAISDVKIPVESSVVKFNNFGIYGANDNPLLVNGTVDLRSLFDIKWNLGLKANNLMLVNSTKAAKRAQIFGKAYIDLNADVVGSMRYTKVDANLTLLSGSNFTYLLNFDSSTLTETVANDNMVRFVNFNDTKQVVQADSATIDEMLMALDATLTLQSGTTITVNLPTGARDKVQVQPQGTLNYTQSPLSDGRMTGRITINSGMARYTLPVIGGEKSFTFDQGSYIAFNGDILNPVLNLHAVDVVKTNVSAEGQGSRNVNFDVMLGITGTLSTMDVKFDLATNDDITVANELQSMSAEQRANQAMNLLLYNMYTGPGTTTNANNPLFSFLESQVNSWAANNIKGVDLSFGIEQYDGKQNAQAMTYSYQVSKTLFNDRFKIVVGGNYSTNDNPEENLSQNLINDISFEYFLNKQQTMLLKLFRHTGYESILEGEVTQTGVGFVYRRKMGRLSQMLPKFMRPKRKRSSEK